jgi:uncharacterized protein YceK
MTRALLSLVLAVSLSGCATVSKLSGPESALVEAAREAAGCSRVVATRHKPGWAVFDGCDRQFECRSADGVATCEETAMSPPVLRRRQAARAFLPVVARATGCPVDAAELAYIRGGAWTVSLCDRAFLCSEGGDCGETEESEARMFARIAIDRLALESGCPTADISPLEQARYSRGKETAFRLSACGSRYVCTTAPGRTDCKRALSDGSGAEAAR